MYRWAAGVFLSAHLLALTACEDRGYEPPEVDVVYTGALVRLSAEPGLEPCGGTGPRMDRLVQFLDDEFGLGLPDEPLDVYWLAPETFDETSPCRPGAVGCYGRSEEIAFVSFVPEEHELVHAYLSERIPAIVGHSFFEEGLAMAYTTSLNVPRPRTDLRESMAFADALPGEHYPRAGHFVGFMIAEYGPADVARFVATVGESEAEVQEKFAATFGESLETFIARYEAQAEECHPDALARQLQCSLEPTPWASVVRWEEEFDLGCEDEVSLGMAGRQFPSVSHGDGAPVTYLQYRTLDFTEERGYELALETEGIEPPPDGEVVAMLRSCGGCEQAYSLEIDKFNHSWFNFNVPPGRYTLRVTATSERGYPVSFRIQ